MKVTEAPTYFWIEKVYQDCQRLAFVLESLDFIMHTQILNFLQELKLYGSCLRIKVRGLVFLLDIKMQPTIWGDCGNGLAGMKFESISKNYCYEFVELYVYIELVIFTEEFPHRS